MKFPSEKGVLTGLVFVAVILLLIFIFISAITNSQNGFDYALFILFVPVLFFSWLWFGTSYKIDEEFVYYKSGPFFGKIKISNIRIVEKNKTLWVGFRPALALKGLIVRYGKYDEIYFSPVDKEKFVGLLQSVNPDIQVHEN